MSMNIHIQASRDIMVMHTGAIEQQHTQYHAWQTPTQVTYAICRSADPAQAYADWVMSRTEPETVAVFAEDDIWEQGPPTGTRVIHPGQEHVDDFRAWLEQVQAQGYRVEYHIL